MASAFAHVLVPVSLCLALHQDMFKWRLLFLGMTMSVLPDIDVAGFYIGIPYASQWGHRGFTHSIAFALLVAALASGFAKRLNSKPVTVFMLSFLACISHAALDTLTNGGLGVALYWPINSERVFAPLRPILVSPIGVSNFFTARSWSVLASELQWVLLPCTALTCLAIGLQRLQRPSTTDK
jgi:inner membrane protein